MNHPAVPFDDDALLPLIGRWIRDPHDESEKWSDEIHTILGIPPEAPFCSLSERFRPLNAKLRLALLTGETSFQGHLIHRRDDGRRIRLFYQAVVERDADGSARLVHGTLQDVTASHPITEEAPSFPPSLQKVQDFSSLFNNLIDSLQDGVFITDLDYVILRTNKKLEETYSFCMPMVGKRCHLAFNVSEICPGCPAQKMFLSGKRETNIHQETNFEGPEPAWLEHASHPLVDPETGAIVGSINVIRDITTNVKNEEELIRYRHSLEELVRQRSAELQRSEHRLRAILENSAACILFCDHAEKITYTNASLSRYTGYEQDEIIGRSIYDFINGGEIDRHDPGVIQKRTERADFFAGRHPEYLDRRIPIRRKDGETVWADVCASSQTDGDQSLFVLVITDVSDRVHLFRNLEAAKQAAESANGAKSRFLATMSHEIRTPLNGVIGMSELLLKTKLTAKQDEYAQLIRSSGKSLLYLICDILDFSKIEAGKMEIEIDVFDLYESIESVLGVLAARAAAKHVELCCVYGLDLPRSVRGDGDRIRQILVNLVGNAVKFTEHGGILLKVDLLSHDDPDSENDMVRFRVLDTGIGIPPNQRERLFNAFSQIDGSSTQKSGGTGLGLSISRQLAKLMGGNVDYVDAPGMIGGRQIGAVFSCTLPLGKVIDESRPLLPETWDTVIPFLFGLRTLLVSADAFLRETLREQLTLWKTDVNVCATPDEVLRLGRESLAAGNPFRLIILDRASIGRPGRELAEQFDAIFSETVTPVILHLLPLAEDVDESARRGRGIVRYLHKPVYTSILLGTIAEAFYEGGGVFTGPRIPFDPSLKPSLRASAVSSGAASFTNYSQIGQTVSALPENTPDRSCEEPAHAKTTSGKPAPFPVCDSAGIEPESTSKRRDERILVAEDNRINQIVVAEILGSAGFQYEIVGNGVEVCRAATGGDYDLILMDCQMPEMDGYEASRTIRLQETEKGSFRRNRKGRIPIIALTANAMKGDETLCYDAGMDAYCSKPINPERLLELIGGYLETAQ